MCNFTFFFDVGEREGMIEALRNLVLSNHGNCQCPSLSAPLLLIPKLSHRFHYVLYELFCVTFSFLDPVILFLLAGRILEVVGT